MTATVAKRWFVGTLWVVMAIKMWLAIEFPMTGDEAFFHEWANFPDWAYYDHPPMVGWLLWLLTRAGHDAGIIRSATVLLTPLIAWGVVKTVQLLESPRASAPSATAWLAGAAYLSLPVSWYFVFVTTDTPLVFFMAVSCYAFVRALKQDSLTWLFAAGLLLGLAFMSKYFAALLGFAMGWAVLWRPRRWTYALVLIAGTLPGVLLNLWTNAHYCWSNVMFNLVNRHEDAHLGWQTVATYLGMMVYLIGPWVLWSLYAQRGFLRGLTATQKPVLALLGVPFVLFLVISLKKTIGLHWVLGFLPAVFVLAGLVVQRPEVLKRWVKWNALLGIPHVLIFSALMYAPVSWFKSESFAQDVMFHRNGANVVSGLIADMPQGAVLTTVAYSPAALMSYHLGQVVPVFGPGKYHARNDDFFVDWRQYDGRSVRVVSKAKPLEMGRYTPYLSNIRVQRRVIEGVPFYILDGDQFNYSSFRAVVLKEAVDKYYQIPTFLPVLDCPFARKYGFEQACRLKTVGPPPL